MLSDNELLRYSRQIMLPQVDIAGQERLKAARVLIVGAGGLGSPAALYLAAAGVGEIHLVDFDTVDTSNLQRQVLHHDADVGRKKVESARDALLEVNPHIQVITHDVMLDESVMDDLLNNIDVVLDCCDNFATRDLVNQACFKHKVVLVSGAAIGFNGQLSVFDFHRADSPCYRCLYPDADEAALACSEAGVLASVVGVVGTMQAHEALKAITQAGRLMVGRLWVWNGLDMDMRTLRIAKDPACPVCSDGEVK